MKNEIQPLTAELTELNYICVNIQHCTQDISLLNLYPAQNKKIIYRAGQYVEMIFPDNTRMPMSIANMPGTDGRLEFHLRHDEKHVQARHAISQLFPHQQVRLRGPFGNTTLSRAPTRDLLFLAGGTGFAPIKALLEEALYHQSLQYDSLHLYWGIRKPQDNYQAKLLHQWQQIFPHFRYTLILSEPASFPHWQGPTGLVHEYLAKAHSCLMNYTLYASGPYEMVKAAQNHFIQQGSAANHLISDML